jgi:acyl-CoA synthetase (AMP-forming)/AMP-acid ligase II
MSLSLLLDMAASGHADRIALGTRATGVTFGALASGAGGGATVIAEHGPAHLVFVGRNGPAYPQLMFAAAVAGVPFVPLNYRLAREQLHELLGELENSLIIADDAYLPLLHEHDAEVMSTDDFLAAAAAAAPSDAAFVDDDATAVLLFTSGTTAKPKAVVLRHENLTSYIFSTVEFGSAGEDEAALVAVPPYHVAAVGSALSNIYSGRRVVYLPDFDAEGWLQTVREEGITSAMVVPTMLARVVDLIGDGDGGAPALKLISYGGARMPRPVLEHALRAFPGTDFVNAYGLTETSSTIALLGPDDHREAFASDDPAVRNRLGSIGRPVPGIEVQIRDEYGEPVIEGAVGALWVRGAQVSGEYRGQGSALDTNGWFHTRDLAWADADGYLFIEGRADDTIIRGGENIAPAEIEDVLIQHPAVKDVAIIGIPDEEWGEKIYAVVVREPGADPAPDELKAFVRERLRGSRTPDHVVWRSALPHTATGKLLRRELVTEIASPPPLTTQES